MGRTSKIAPRAGTREAVKFGSFVELRQHFSPAQLDAPRRAAKRQNYQQNSRAFASSAQPCAACGQWRQGSQTMALPLFGQVFHASVCPICYESVRSSGPYRASVAHGIAQRQHHEACHA